jgi:hypothetical protein
MFQQMQKEMREERQNEKDELAKQLEEMKAKLLLTQAHSTPIKRGHFPPTTDQGLTVANTSRLINKCHSLQNQLLAAAKKVKRDMASMVAEEIKNLILDFGAEEPLISGLLPLPSSVAVLPAWTVVDRQALCLYIHGNRDLPACSELCLRLCGATNTFMPSSSSGPPTKPLPMKSCGRMSFRSCLAAKVNKKSFGAWL